MFPAAGRPGDHDGAAVAGPVGLGEAEDLGAIQAARMAEVDVLDGGRAAEPGGLQAAVHAPAGPRGELAVHEQAEAFAESEPGAAGLPALPGGGGGHGVRPQGFQPVDGGAIQHGKCPFASCSSPGRAR